MQTPPVVFGFLFILYSYRLSGILNKALHRKSPSFETEVVLNAQLFYPATLPRLLQQQLPRDREPTKGRDRKHVIDEVMQKL